MIVNDLPILAAERQHIVRAYNALSGAVVAEDSLNLRRALRYALDELRLGGEYALADRLRQVYIRDAIFISDVRDIKAALAAKL